MMRFTCGRRSARGIEETAYSSTAIERTIRAIIPPDELEMISDNIGLPVSYALLFYQTDSIGPQDADMQIQLKKPNITRPRYIKQIRSAMLRQFPGVTSYLQAADIISQVLSFGLSAPIDVQVVGPRSEVRLQHRAELNGARWRPFPAPLTCGLPQVLDYPALRVNVDRAKALQIGITEEQRRLQPAHLAQRES